MCDEDDVLAVSAAIIVFLSATLVLQRRRRPRRYWIRPSLQATRKYNTTDFIKDLILDDEDAPNLKYRSGAGFKNFFRVSISTFTMILNIIGPRISRRDTQF
ncbi:hypothetical protein PGB90_007388 [Kerria lacca]